MHLAEDRKKGVTDCLTDGMSWLTGSSSNTETWSQSVVDPEKVIERVA